MTRKCGDDLILVSSDSDSSFTEVPKGDALLHNPLTFNKNLLSNRYPSDSQVRLAFDEPSAGNFNSYELGLNNKNSCGFKQPEPPDIDKINSPLNKKSNKGKGGRHFKNKEKEKINEEKQREKLTKKKASDLVTRMKPGTCMNYISVVVDDNLINCKFGGKILSSIVECGSSHIVKTQCIPYSITWIRTIVDEIGSTVTEEENFALIVWDAEHFLTKVEIDNVQDSIKVAQNNLPGKSLTLAIYNLEKYLKKDNERKCRNSAKDQSKRKYRRSVDFNIFSLEVEELFIELQLLYECSIWILNTVEDVGNLISQFTKAVAEKPYKIEKQNQQVEGLGWLATCDLKGVVRVDKSGNGLLKLWQQQLMQFNNSGLDVAQAITEKYPTPLALYEAYCLCENSKEGEELLKDILIRRGFGEAAATRRIGPELSKKIFYFFNSHDSNLPLSQD